MIELRAKLLLEKNKRVLRRAAVLTLALLMLLLATSCSLLPANDQEGSTASTTGEAEKGFLGGILGDRSTSVDIVLLLTVLTLLPSILIMLTCFTRLIIVLSLVRNGLGLQQMPPNQVLIGLALFVTLFIMTPTINTIKETAYEPYVAGIITEDEAGTRAMAPIREFMFAQTYPSDMKFFMNASGQSGTVENLDEIENTTLIPAFITSEIKHGFEIGFFLYIPFIVVDMVVASTLMAMGMMMLPPTVISLPFKLLLFVLVDGWTLTVKTLITSFN